MTETLTIDAGELTGTEVEIRALIAKAVELRVAGNSQASFDLLMESEGLVESVSVSRQGRFFNQRALALKDLGEYDRAILEFDRAAICFQESGETELQGMVHNNIARVYSLSGNYERAHESVDKAIGLAKDPRYLIQWRDQKANVFCDEGKLNEAEAQLNTALELLCGIEHQDLIAECLLTKTRIIDQKRKSCAVRQFMIQTPASPVFPQSKTPTLRGEPLLSTAIECAKSILSLNYEVAMPLFSLLAMVADPDGDPDRYSAAWGAMQFLFALTPHGEAELNRLIEDVQRPPQEVGETSS